MTELLVVFSTLMTRVMLVLAALEVAANAALHRTVSGSPRPSFSGEGMAAWLTRLRDLFVPAVIAFVASAMCNIGTSVLLDDYRDRGSLWGSAGTWWLIGGLLVVGVAFLVLVAWPERSPWELTQSYEALTNHVRSMSSVNVPEVERVESRLAETDARADGDPSRALAGAEYVVAPALLGVVPKWWSSNIVNPDTGQVSRPTWTSTWRWAWSRRRSMSVVAMVTLALAGSSAASAVFQRTELVPTGLALLVAAACALVVAAAGLRSDLSWQGRLVAEDKVFASEVRAWVNRSREQLAPQHASLPAGAPSSPSSTPVFWMTVLGWTWRVDRAQSNAQCGVTPTAPAA